MAYDRHRLGVPGGGGRNFKATPALTSGAKTEYVVNFDTLDGGLNIYDLDYRLDANESPNMKNLRWRDGALGCRPGQVEILAATASTDVGYAAAPELFWDYCFVHIGAELRCYDPTAQTVAYTVLHSSVPENRGTFFRYGDKLYYKNVGGYYQISYDPDGATVSAMFPTAALGESGFLAEIPIIQINSDPTTHAGDLYQPENRLCSDKEIWYTSRNEGSTAIKKYYLPVAPDSILMVVVDGVEWPVGTTGNTYRFTAGTDYVQFNTAPPVHNPAEANTVRITYRAANTAAYNSVMQCPYAIVYGGDQDLCIVVGGCPAQPNAYFWNGNDELVMRPTYFPMEHYNFAGDTESAVMGFGKQQGFLVVFSTHGIGKASMGTTTTTTDREQIEMPYTAINSKVGCDYPWSIQLVKNNLVFCNEHGVYILLDSSAAHENNVEDISRKVNGNDRRHGIMFDIHAAGKDGVYSTVHDEAYWLVANTNAYVWDYELSTYTDPSWFYYTNIQGIAYTKDYDELYHLDEDGRASRFSMVYSDYGEPIDKVYRFPVQNMGTYDRLKDVVGMIFVVRSDTNAKVDIEYQTDYGNRFDLTPILSYSWSLVPRNLAMWFLGVARYARVERRQPDCRHVRHFTAELSNNTVGSDLSVVSAQMLYKLVGRQK